jgi:hypothetical protein
MLRIAFLHLILSTFFFHTHAVELSKNGFFTRSSLLYWQAQEEGLCYAVESSSSEHLSSGAKALNPDFEWDFGFNVGLGYRAVHDKWQLLLQLTCFKTHNDSESDSKEGRVFFPSWSVPKLSSTLFATYVKEHWRLHLALIDLLLSKDFNATGTLTLAPQIGVRWGSVRQKFNIEYRGGNFPPGGDILIRMKNKFEGLGLCAGLKGEYAIGKGFSLLAQGAFSLLYGEFYLHQDEDGLASKVKRLGLHSIYCSSSSILEGSAGFRWQRDFFSSLKRLTLDLAWDQLILFSQNQLLRFVDNSQPGISIDGNGDLAIVGVCFNASLDF